MSVIEEPLHCTRVTKTFRNISRIYNKVTLIIDIVLAAIFGVIGLVLLPLGIAAIVDPTIFADAETTIEAATALGISFTGCGGTFLICAFVFALMIVYRTIIRKYIVKPTHEQFLGLAIASFIICGDTFMTAFFIIIYIFEGNRKKVDERIASEQ